MCRLPGRIILIDDAQFVLKYYSEFLGEAFPSLKIDTAGSFKDASLLLTNHRYDLVVSDFQLNNGKTGFQLFKKFHHHKFWIIMTADNEVITEGHPELDVISKQDCPQIITNIIHKRLLVNDLARKVTTLKQSMNSISGLLNYA